MTPPDPNAMSASLLASIETLDRAPFRQAAANAVEAVLAMGKDDWLAYGKKDPDGLVSRRP